MNPTKSCVTIISKFLSTPSDKNFQAFMDIEYCQIKIAATQKLVQELLLKTANSLIENEKSLHYKFHLVKEVVNGLSPDLQSIIAHQYTSVFCRVLNRVTDQVYGIVRPISELNPSLELELCKRFAKNLCYQTNIDVGISFDPNNLHLNTARVLDSEAMKKKDEFFRQIVTTFCINNSNEEDSLEALFCLNKFFNRIVDSNGNPCFSFYLHITKKKVTDDFSRHLQEKINYACEKSDVSNLVEYLKRNIFKMLEIGQEHARNIVNSLCKVQSESEDFNALFSDIKQRHASREALHNIGHSHQPNGFVINCTFIKNNLLGNYKQLNASDKGFLIERLKRLKSFSTQIKERAGTSKGSPNDPIEKQLSAMRDIENIADYIVGKKAIFVKKALEAQLPADLKELIINMLLSIN